MNSMNLERERCEYQLGFLAIVFTIIFGSLAFGQATDVRPLPSNQTIEREMSGNETHLYKFELKKGEDFQVHVEQKGIDVVLKFLDVRGMTMLTRDMPTGSNGPEFLCGAASENGNHTLEITGFDKKAKKGTYTIRREPPTMCHAIEPDVVYGHKDGLALTMDVYRPQSTRTNGAAILYIESGGWFSGWVPPYVSSPFFHPFLEKGYTVMEVRHGSSPKYSLPEIVSDIRRAVRFVRQNAKKLNVDADRLGVIGLSAGGHLALMIGTTGDDGSPDAEDDLDRISSRVAAAVAWSPPSDLRVMVWEAPESLPFYKTLPALNISVKESEQYSPLVHVTKDDAPSLVIMGGKDELIPAKHGRWIDEAFGKKGVPHKLIIIPDAGHNLKQYDGTRATAYRESIAWFDRFLLKRE